MEAITRAHLDGLTPMKRRTFIRAMINSFVITNNLNGLLEFLKNDEIVGSRMLDKGPDFINQDLFRSYHFYANADPFLHHEFLRTFLHRLFALQETIDLNNVFVWLQTIDNNQLITDALDVMSSNQWLPHDADPQVQTIRVIMPQKPSKQLA